MDIHSWKVSRDGVVLAQIEYFMYGLEPNKVVAKALDGTVYVQTVGVATKIANVSVHCTREEKYLMDLANADGAQLSIAYRGMRYYGFIEEEIDWDATVPGEWYHGDFKFIVDEMEEADENSDT